MPTDQARPLSVLVAKLEPVAAVGMCRLLAEDGVYVSADDGEPAEVVARALRDQPDAVVLDLECDAALWLSDQVRAAAPAAKVILWDRGEGHMQVLDPGALSPRFVRTAIPEALRLELTQTQPPRRGA